MIKINLPINRREFVDGKIVDNKSVITAYVDISIFVEERWEKNFPELAKRETLLTYLSRIQNLRQKSSDKPSIAEVGSMLKVLYCCLESDDLPTFKSFVQMFDTTDELFAEQFKIMEDVLKYVQTSSVVSAKNLKSTVKN